MARLDVAVTLLPAAHAVEEITRVIGGISLPRRFLRLDHRLGARAPSALVLPVGGRAGREFVGCDVIWHHFESVTLQVECTFRPAKLNLSVAQSGRGGAGIELREGN